MTSQTQITCMIQWKQMVKKVNWSADLFTFLEVHNLSNRWSWNSATGDTIWVAISLKALKRH